MWCAYTQKYPKERKKQDYLTILENYNKEYIKKIIFEYKLNNVMVFLSVYKSFYKKMKRKVKLNWLLIFHVG